MGGPTCRAGMRLVAGATPADPKNIVAPFCIDEHEYTQREEAALDATKPYYLIVRRCDFSAWNHPTPPDRRPRDDIFVQEEHARMIVARGTLAHVTNRIGKFASWAYVCGLEIEKAVQTAGAPAEQRRGDRNKPAVMRRWDEAKAICQARGMDLPTKEQWRKAVSGRSGKEDAMKGGVPRGNKACYRHDDEPRDGPCEVMSYPPNEFGLYDMTGNVEEWVLFYGEDKNIQTVFESGSYHSKIDRRTFGGSWRDTRIWKLRYLSGDTNKFDDAADTIGFRCAAAPVSPPKDRPLALKKQAPPRTPMSCEEISEIRLVDSYGIGTARTFNMPVGRRCKNTFVLDVFLDYRARFIDVSLPTGYDLRSERDFAYHGLLGGLQVFRNHHLTAASREYEKFTISVERDGGDWPDGMVELKVDVSLADIPALPH